MTVRNAVTPQLLSQLSAFLGDAEIVYRNTASARFAARESDAPGFNIFKVTRRGHYEVTTHQPILANLLNANGSHAQGGLFLDKWLGILERRLTKAGKSAIPFPRDMFWSIDHGLDRIDVRLRHPTMHVVIEMKWDHLEKKDQLLDYWREEAERAPGKRILAVYLTKHGRPPVCDDSAFNRALVCVSFGDIEQMLSDVSEQIGAGRVRGCLEQYIELLSEVEV